MKDKVLIGYTGFVGKNLAKQTHFEKLYNSKNFKDMTNQSYDLVVCSGISATMWLANNEPEKDLKNIQELLDVISTIKSKMFVLISTIAIYKHPVKSVYEDTILPETKLSYGKHRYYAENFIKKKFDNCLIVRLPALFGNGLKKNFVFDLINLAPKFITVDHYNMLEKKYKLKETLNKYYINEKNSSFFILKEKLSVQDKKELIEILKEINCTSLQFTHKESQYQFYCLDNLWKDISIAIKNKLKILNITSEPIKAKEIAKKCININFNNKTKNPPFFYDMRTKFSNLYGKKGDYLYQKDEILESIKYFIKKESSF